VGADPVPDLVLALLPDVVVSSAECSVEVIAVDFVVGLDIGLVFGLAADPLELPDQDPRASFVARALHLAFLVSVVSDR
jgi:hypothetical protein